MEKIVLFFFKSGQRNAFFLQKFYSSFTQDVTIVTLTPYSEPQGNEIFSCGESSFYSF